MKILTGLFVCLIWFISPNISAQILFNETIFDCGQIEEEGDSVSHIFSFENKYSDQVEIISIQPSCGCTLSDIKSRVVKARSKSWIKLTYNPKGRPGYFVKPAKVKFLHQNDTISMQIALKGFTISQDFKDRHLSNQAANYHIEIAQLKHDIVYLDRWHVNNNNRTQSFVDDITFIIDQYGIVEIQSLLTLKAQKDTALIDQEFSNWHLLLLKELKRRNYPSYTIVFKDSVTIVPSRLPNSTARLIASPSNFTNPSLKKSIIRDKNVYPNHHKTRPEGITAKTIHYADIPLDPNFSDDRIYQKFIKTCVRNGLSRQELWLRVSSYNLDKKERDLSKKVEKKIKKDLIRQGLDPSIITILKTNIPQSKLHALRISEELPPIHDSLINLSISKIDTIVPFSFQNTETVFNHPQNIPAYFQQIKGYVSRIDTTNEFYIRMMAKVIDEIKEGRSISFIMESSASKAPAPIKEDNFYVARLRAEESKKIITDYLLNKGLRMVDIRFKETIPLVSGPEYDVWRYLPQYYYYFQYLKLIPVYDVSERISTIRPYKINFGYNNLDVMDESEIFQTFLDQLADNIRYNGYVKLILESSSSKVPTTTMSKNEHLSYHRAQEAKNKLYAGIKARGFNPSKVIFMEERILVRGPEYKDDFKKNAKTYKQYQYLKILPFNQLKD